MLSWNEMRTRNEHASQAPALVEIPVGLKIMSQNTPTAYEELKIYACEVLS